MQQTSDNCRLTTLVDGGRDQVLSTIDRRPSPVDHTQRPAKYTTQWSIWRDAERRACPSALAETCAVKNLFVYPRILCGEFSIF